jgi:hypothetical protein
MRSSASGNLEGSYEEYRPLHLISDPYQNTKLSEISQLVGRFSSIMAHESIASMKSAQKNFAEELLQKDIARLIENNVSSHSVPDTNIHPIASARNFHPQQRMFAPYSHPAPHTAGQSTLECKYEPRA